MCISIIRRILILLLLLHTSSCISYINQTTYRGFNIAPTEISTADPTNPIVVFVFQKELTSNISPVPVIWVHGEQKDFKLRVHIHGEGAKKYSKFILKSIAITQSSRVIFSSYDSLLVSEDMKSKPGYLYYTSDYSIRFNTKPKEVLIDPDIQANYILIRKDGVREQHKLESKLNVDRRKRLDY